MKLKSVLIKNFKSIKRLRLEFSDNLYCLVGQNETGKSNILQAISFLGIRKEKSEAEKAKLGRALPDEYIEGTFELDESDKSSLLKLRQSLEIPNKSYGVAAITGIKLVTDKIKIATKHIAFVINNSEEVLLSSVTSPHTQETFLAKILELLPSIEYYEKEDFLLSPLDLAKFNSDSENSSFQSFKRLFALGGVSDISKFSELATDEIIYLRESVSNKINDLISKYYRSDYNLEVKIESHNGVFTLFFNDKYKKLDNLNERSTGVQYFISFLINKLYLKQFGKKNAVFLIDEPGLSLHPKSQKKFISLLQDFSINNLVIYTTHSPFSINRMKPTRVWVVERNYENGTVINHKPFQHNWRPLRSSLGIDFSDSFFYADKSLLVEGPEDRIFIGSLIHYFIRKGKIILNSDLLSIIDAASISNMPAMVQILLDENRPMFVLIDNDNTKVHNRLKKKVVEINDKDVLSLTTIADIKKDAISIEDILPIDLYFHSVKLAIENLVNEGTIHPAEERKHEIPLDLSLNSKRYAAIAKGISDLYRDSDNGSLDSKTPISKVGIAHEFEKLISKIESLGTEEEEKVCLNLIRLIIDNLKLG